MRDWLVFGSRAAHDVPVFTHSSPCSGVYKDATRGSWAPGLTTRNKKLLGTMYDHPLPA